MKPNKNLISVFTLSFGLLFSAGKVSAQLEIPDNIKDNITKGIEAFENAKSPSDIDKALSEFSQAEKTAPDFPDVHYYLGKTYACLQGNAAKAVKELKKYLELYPDAPEKDEVTADIERLEKAVASKRQSTLNGVELMELPDGIYIRKLIGNKVGGRITSRSPEFSIMPGDKVVSVKNTDISGLPLDDVLKLFDRDSTTRFVSVEVIRGGEKHSVVLERSTKTYPSDVLVLGEEDLDAIIEESPLPVIVVFLNASNPDSKNYMFHVSRAAYQNRDKEKIVMAYAEDNVTLASQYNVTVIPTILFYRDKKLIGKITGFQPDLFTQKAAEIDTTHPFGL